MPYSQLRSNRPELADALPLDLPYSIYLEPTNRCNFRCKMCPSSFPDYRETVKESGMMNLDLYEKIIGDIKSMGRLKSLKLYMVGEPLLHRDIAEMVGIAKKKQVANRVEITTNASLLTQDMSRRLIAAGLDYLRVSIYSVYPKEHKRITQSRYTVEQIYRNVADFKDVRMMMGSPVPFLYVKMLDKFGPENSDFIERYSSVADEIFIEPVMNWNGYAERDLVKGLYPGVDIYQSQSYFNNIKEVCPFPFYSLVVSCNGDVTICCVDWNKGTIVGNLKNESLYDIWHGTRLREFRRLHLSHRRGDNLSCRNCTFLYTAPDNLDGLSQEKIRLLI